MRTKKNTTGHSKGTVKLTKRAGKKPSRADTSQLFQGINFEPLETRQLMAVVNVSDFGARPNDGANDLGAVQSAINASRAGDTILFSGGTFNFSDGMTIPGDRTYKGQNGATLAGRSGEGQLFALHSNNVTFQGLTFSGGGVFIDSAAGGMNQNIVFDSNVFRLNTSGIHANAITFTSGLQNSRLTNNYFTGYNGGFAVYGYNYNALTIANNEFVNVTAGMHIDAFGNSGNLLVEQNYLSGVKRMGFEFQSSASNLVFQDNWYENPNLSPSFHDNDGSMAYSLILDKSSNITIRRNVVIAPQRPDGVGTRIGFEVGGDNALVEDNYINGVNHVLAVNDGVGSCSVTVRNNKWMNYLQGAGMSFPASNRTWVNQNNGPGTQLSSTMESRVATGAKPGIGSKRYGGGSTNTTTPAAGQLDSTSSDRPGADDPDGAQRARGDRHQRFDRQSLLDRSRLQRRRVQARAIDRWRRLDADCQARQGCRNLHGQESDRGADLCIPCLLVQWCGEFRVQQFRDGDSECAERCWHLCVRHALEQLDELLGSGRARPKQR